MKHLRDWLLEDALEHLSALFLVVITILAIAQVVTRYVFNSPSPWTEEVARLLLVWATFLAAGAAAKKHQLLSVDVLLERLPRRGQSLCLALINIVTLCVSLVLLIWGWRLYEFTSGDTSTSLGYPRNLFFLPLVIGGALMSIASILNVIAYIKNAFSPDPDRPLEEDHALPNH